MWLFWRTWSVLLCACSVLAQRIDQEAMMSPRTARVRDRDNVKADEPSCDQLKAMWRFSKRQARAPEIMNEVSTNRDPFMFNVWPMLTPALPRPAPRFRSQYPALPREAFGRVMTKAPANVVRSPEYDEMYAVLNMPHTSGKILRFPGPSRARGSTYMTPPQRHGFEALKKLIRIEHLREMQRNFDTEQKQQDLMELTGHKDDYAYGNYVEQDTRALQPVQVEPQYPADEPQYRQQPNRKPQSGRQVSQFSRYSDVMLPPTRRNFRNYRPYAYQFAEPMFN